jgi:hypothetical protein
MSYWRPVRGVQIALIGLDGQKCHTAFTFVLIALRRVDGVRTTPLYVKPQISYKNGTGHVTILVGEKLPNKVVDSITLVVPLPKAVATCDLAANCGSVHYDAASKAGFAIDDFDELVILNVD